MPLAAQMRHCSSRFDNLTGALRVAPRLVDRDRPPTVRPETRETSRSKLPLRHNLFQSRLYKTAGASWPRPTRRSPAASQQRAPSRVASGGAERRLVARTRDRSPPNAPANAHRAYIPKPSRRRVGISLGGTPRSRGRQSRAPPGPTLKVQESPLLRTSRRCEAGRTWKSLQKR